MRTEYKSGQILLGEPIPPEGTDLPLRSDPSQSVHLSPQEIANYLVVMVADIAEQMTPVISYRDVYHSASPEVLWPGNGEPVAGFFHMVKLRNVHLINDDPCNLPRVIPGR